MLFSWRLAWYLAPALTLRSASLSVSSLCTGVLSRPRGPADRAGWLTCCVLTAVWGVTSCLAPDWGGAGSCCSDLAEGLGRTEDWTLGEAGAVDWSRPGWRWPALTFCHHLQSYSPTVLLSYCPAVLTSDHYTIICSTILPCHHINPSTSSSPHPSYQLTPGVASLEKKSIIEAARSKLLVRFICPGSWTHRSTPILR